MINQKDEDEIRRFIQGHSELHYRENYELLCTDIFFKKELVFRIDPSTFKTYPLAYAISLKENKLLKHLEHIIHTTYLVKGFELINEKQSDSVVEYNPQKGWNFEEAIEQQNKNKTKLFEFNEDEYPPDPPF